jgi:hypothetical protein
MSCGFRVFGRACKDARLIHGQVVSPRVLNCRRAARRMSISGTRFRSNRPNPQLRNLPRTAFDCSLVHHQCGRRRT